ncbi:hypothetical protein C7974DRAFT_182614 [Boeremia exigua]|uniref:uncharacterized protein n=1 Tax=Boeremia exigua TaxID=749465 RepID=UPI001E8D4984|nr:uncharacterized protein C7974DRAFT_182614 [Boeremia exigua]KAH6629184.1 hypothetical protein C7974DRAFT_182614 [Boeremia exigua]
MNSQPSTSDRNDNEQSSSPKRKKVRQKYAPKACVSCRRSKLKCSGHNPCQRCRDHGKRCFFSEDQTAAEALQNLSRPSLPQQAANPVSESNGSSLTRRNLMPRHRDNERTASDASDLGLSMEARMSRIEVMMEALLQERAMYAASNGNPERDDTGSDIPMSLPLVDPINPALSFLSQPPHDSQPQDAIDPLLGTDTTTIRFGGQSFVFPVPTVYQNHIDTFFRELQVCHPCIDEHLFRTRSVKMLAEAKVHPDNACFLALNYIIFALHAASTEGTRPGSDDKLAGWHWLQLADDVIGKRQFYGQGDISLAQFLFLKAIYCTLVDQPGLAYSSIGSASSYVLQQGLNRQASLHEAGVWESFERLRVFWNILIADRRISLSCGRPYTIRDTDIDVERPSNFYQRGIAPNLQLSQEHAQIHKVDSESKFLGCMVDWSRFAGSLWDGVLAAHVSADTLADNVATFDAAVADFLDNTLQALKTDFHPSQRHPYVCMSFDNLRVIARRTVVTSLDFERATVLDCSRLAVDTLAHVQAYDADIRYPLTCILRHHIVPSLASSLLLLCSILVSDLDAFGLPLDEWLPLVHATFDSTVALLLDLADELSSARRVLRDFEKILPVVQAVLARWSAQTQLLQGPLEWGIVRDIIPPNVTELLPYTEQVPDIRSKALQGMWAGNGGHLETDRSWDESYGVRGARSGVLWI